MAADPTRATLTLDMAKALTAVARSIEAKKALEQVTKELEDRADANARSDAYDEGYYYRLMESEVSTGAQLQNSFERRYKGAYRTRQRQGSVGKNRFVDVVILDDGTSIRYSGPVGIVRGRDFKSVWLEFGSIARNPSFCMTRAAESMAAQTPDIEFVRIYESNRSQDLSALGKKISEGKLKAAAKRSADLDDDSDMPWNTPDNPF